MNYDYIMAIDPDVDKSGIALINTKTKRLGVFNLNFPSLVDSIIEFKDDSSSYLIIIEAGWKNKSHWHISTSDTKRSSAMKGNAVGRNHETGRKIVEMFEHFDFDVIEEKPLKKFWKGKDGKITHEELNQVLRSRGIDELKHTNQENRDAILLCLKYVL